MQYVVNEKNETFQAFRWMEEKVTQWWTDMSGNYTLDVSSGTVNTDFGQVRRGDYILKNEKTGEIFSENAAQFDVNYKNVNTSDTSVMEYFIENRDSGFLGNSIVFWGKDNRSYTAKLEKAKRFSYDEAKKICIENPTKYKAWEADYIVNNEGTATLTDSNYLDFGKRINFK